MALLIEAAETTETEVPHLQLGVQAKSRVGWSSTRRRDEELGTQDRRGRNTAPALARATTYFSAAWLSGGPDVTNAGAGDHAYEVK